MDSKSTAQEAIFVHDVNERFDVTEKLAATVPLQGITKDSDLLEAAMTTLNTLK